MYNKTNKEITIMTKKYDIEFKKQLVHAYMQGTRDKRLLVSEKNNSRLFSAESPVYSYIPVEVHDFFYKGMHQVIKRGIIPAFYNGPQACEGGYSSFL